MKIFILKPNEPVPSFSSSSSSSENSRPNTPNLKPEKDVSYVWPKNSTNFTNLTVFEEDKEAILCKFDSQFFFVLKNKSGL